MLFFDRFPFTKINEINLDWILSVVKEAKDSIENADSRITQAQTDATNANTAAQSAVETANTANENAETALENSGSALDTARSAAQNSFKNIFIPSNFKNLLDVFPNIAAIHTAISQGNFDKINIGDYFDLHIEGTVHDHAANRDITVNATIRLTVAAINYYSGLYMSQPHVVFVSGALPFQLGYNAARGAYDDPTADNAWTGSGLYKSFNDESDGVITLLDSISEYIYRDLQLRLPTQASGSVDVTGMTYVDVGALFPPTYRAITGLNVTSNPLYLNDPGIMPLFMSSANIKRNTYAGSSQNYWLIGKTSLLYNLIVASNGRVFERFENNTTYSVITFVMI